jgi:t-SNARE complex subunit (syntaxin)
MTPISLKISSLQDDIQAFNSNITRIGDLHSQSLNTMDGEIARRNVAALDELVEDTSALSTALKQRIKILEKLGDSGPDGQTRRQQVTFFWHYSHDISISHHRLPSSSPNLWRQSRVTEGWNGNTEQNIKTKLRDNSILV